MSVNPLQLDLIGKLLDATTVRHQVIGQNVANVNTPGYRQREVVFEEALSEALKSSNGNDLSKVVPEVRLAEGLTTRSDGNNVDIDIEMGRLTKNSLLYETYAQILSTKLGMLRSAISGQP